MNEKKQLFLLIFIMFIVFIGVWVGISYFEMKAFNKFSDKQATLVDAMFAELRITSK